MITFTNKAANEMKERIERYFKSQVCLGFIWTFHSFCANILRRNGANIEIERNFNIYDENDQLGLIKHILKKLESKKYSASYVLYKISSAKNLLIEPKKYQEVFSDYEAEFISQIYQQYQQQLKKNKAVDFDDLLMMTVNLFIKAPAVLEKYQKQYRFFFIDEYQDTNYAQYVLTRMLGYKYRQLTVVGDFSQSIYSWRGADIRNLEKLQEDFPETKVFHLEENYRSPQTILDFAYNIISKNRTHPILKLYTKNNQGEEITYYQAGNEQDEAIYLASEIQKLSQDNSLS